MVSGKELLSRLKLLLANEAYPEALRELRKEGIDTPNALKCISNDSDLLLMIADIYANNMLFEKVEECLSLLEGNVEDIDSNTRYVILKSWLLLARGNAKEALEILEYKKIVEDQEVDRYKRQYQLAKAYFRVYGDYAIASQLFQQCYRFFESKSLHLKSGHTLYSLGYIAFQKGFFDIAESYYKKAEQKYQIRNNAYHMGQVNHMLGILAYRKGEYSRAIEELLKARECFRNCAYRIGLVNVEIAFARVAMFQGRLDEAERKMRWAHNRSRQLSYARGVALCSEFIGEIRYLAGDYKRALLWLKKAEGIALQNAPEGDIAVEVCRRLGDVHIARGELGDAERALSKALEMAQRMSDRYELGTILRAMGRADMCRGEIELARAHYREAISELRLIKESFELARTYIEAAESNNKFVGKENMTSELAEELLSEARSYATEAMHLYSSLGLEERVRHCRDLLRSLEGKIAGGAEPIARSRVRFNSKWLVGGMLVARSRHMSDVVARVEELGPTMIPVLVSGETGTGKELVARLLHEMSDRSAGSFVAVNCANLPEPIFESEMFGHSKGSFTGAVQDKVGLMERASGGTLFLDEVSELSHYQQAKLLRALQDGVIRRIGETRERRVDVRLISATNERVEELVNDGKLRGDFFYRISGATIELEPLRNRRDDISALVAYYMSKQGRVFEVEDGVMELLEGYHWPGNVRELVNVVSALCMLARGSGLIRVCDLPVRIRDFGRSEAQLVVADYGEMGIGKVEHTSGDGDGAIRKLILSTLMKCGGNRTAAARELGMGRSTLYRKMKELNLS